MVDIEKIIACLKELEFSPSIDDFQDRLRLQKINCLLNIGGINTGFSCNLYVRGPYSPALANEFFEQKERFAHPQTSMTLNANEKDFISELKTIFGFNASYLEIGATYAYLTQSERMSSTEAMMKLKSIKSFFSDSQIAIGVSKSKELLSKPSMELIDFVKKESVLWDTASTPLSRQEN